MRATYSPEDNKLRVYPEGERVDARLDESEYERFKKAGYKWAAKQECFVAPRWTPTAERWALDLADEGEIEDEDYSATERSADRAERFSEYREKRAGEAGERLDQLGGPQGYQSSERAARAERRAERHTRAAVSQWEKAEYWQERTRGVIAHALHRAKPEVRRSRIKKLESEQRKHEKERADHAKRFLRWSGVANSEGTGADEVIPEDKPANEWNHWQKRAYVLANDVDGYSWRDITHPRTGQKASAYTFLTLSGENFPLRLTPREVALAWLAGTTDPDDEQSSAAKWSRHYALRLGYERAMLANEGGAAADVEMIAGGWLVSGGNRYQILRVWKSTATGKVSSVALKGKTDRRGKPVRIDLERFGANIYEPPTPEELAAFEAEKKAEKAARAPVPTINPTREDAEALQAILNSAALARYNRPTCNRNHSFAAVPVREITAAKFSDWRRSEYVHLVEFFDGEKRVKIRTHRSAMYRYYDADNVLILTDKPQKRIPLDLEKLTARLLAPEAEPAHA